MPTYVSPFTGTVVTPTDVSYLYIIPEFSYNFYWPSNVPPDNYVLPRILDIEPQVEDLYFTFPQANQGTQGADCLVTNFGAFSFRFYSQTFSQQYIIEPGQSAYFYLASNITQGGYWEKIDFGSTTSVADAISLAGNGLVVRNGYLTVGQYVIDVFADPGLTNTSTAQVYNWIAGNGTIQLPASLDTPSSWFIGFRNSGTGTLTFQPQGSSTVNGQTSLEVNPGESGYLIYDDWNLGFITVGLAPPNNVSFTAATYDVDSIVGDTLSLATFAPTIQTYVALSETRTTNLLVELPPITQLYVLKNNTVSGYDIEFNVAGSLSPNVVTSNGTITLVLSDGNQLAVISQSALPGIFLAEDGTAATPSFSFTSNQDTGMFLENINVLGLSANGVALMHLDNTNPSDPNVRVNGTFKASLIAGGTF
jgi:hypothetical protein